MGAADEFGTGLGQAEMQNLALLDQVFNRAGQVLDWRIKIDAMLLKQIDVIGPKAPERRLDHTLDALWPAIRAAGSVDVETKFGDNLHLAADGSERFVHQIPAPSPTR